MRESEEAILARSMPFDLLYLTPRLLQAKDTCQCGKPVCKYYEGARFSFGGRVLQILLSKS